MDNRKTPYHPLLTSHSTPPPPNYLSIYLTDPIYLIYLIYLSIYLTDPIYLIYLIYLCYRPCLLSSSFMSMDAGRGPDSLSIGGGGGGQGMDFYSAAITRAGGEAMPGTMAQPPEARH